MALTKVSGGILDPGINVAGIVTATGFDGPFTGGSSKNITAGIITATGFDLNGDGDISGNLVIGGNLTANGDFTTLNTTLREVEILRVDANTTAVAGIITQRGSGDILNLYDSSTEVFSVDASGRVKIGTTSNKPAADNEAGIVFGDNTAGTVKKGVGSFVADGAAPLLLTRRVSDGNVLGIADDVGTKGLIRVNSNNLEITSIYALTLATGTGHNQKVRLTNDGKVGIGSMIPAAKLDVNGTSKFQDDVTFLTDTGKNIVIDKSANKMIFGDNVLAEFGNDSDLLMHHTGSTGYIKNQTGNFYIQNDGVIIIGDQTSSTTGFKFQNGGAVELYHNNLRTAFTDVDQWKVYGRTSNSGMIEIASNQGANNNDRFRIHKTSAASRLSIQNYSTGSWVENIRITAGGLVELKHADGTTRMNTTTTGIAVNFRVTASGDENTYVNLGSPADQWQFYTGGVDRLFLTGGPSDGGTVQVRGNNNKLQIGANQDLQLFHDGNRSAINNATGELRIVSGSDVIIGKRSGDDSSYSEQLAAFKVDGAVELYHDGNSKKFETTATGITVTGEVAASQDYPTTRPTLDLNFAAEKKLDPRITYQRTGPASFTDKFGKVVLVGDNAPRFDHDPTTRESKGLLIEESRTNLLYPSSNWSSTYWSLTAVTSEPFTTDTEDPAGTFTASKLIPIDGNTALKDIHWASSSLTFTNGVKYAASVFAKSTTGLVLQLRPRGQGSNKAWVNYNLSTGTIGSYGGTTLLTKEIEKYPNGWYRCSLTFTGSGNSGAGFGTLIMDDDTDTEAVAHTGDSSKSMYLWGAQHEEGAFVTSYIPAPTTAAGTRGADQTYIDGQDFLDFYNQTEGTVISSHSILPNIPSNHNLYTYQIAPTGNTAYAPIRILDKNSSIANSIAVASVYNNGYTFLTTDTGNPVTVAGRKYVIAVSIKKDDYDAVFDGGDLLSDSSGDLYTADHISIGYYKPSPQAYLNGYIQRLIYYPTKLSNNQLKTITS